MKMLLPPILSAAQRFSRKQESGGVPVSLRDVERCVHLYRWFLSISAKKKVLVLTLIHHQQRTNFYL
jgi:hypothetical protein